LNEPIWLRVYRIAFGLLALAAVVRSFFRDDGGTISFLSKFTYESNTFQALVLLGGAFVAPAVIASVRWDRLRGAAVMYAVTTFLVYGFLIEGFYNPFDSDHYWTSTVLHQVIPAALVLELFLRPFANRLDRRSTLLWTIYPIAFLVYSLVRGAITDWYPYDFLDPDETGGYGRVALYAAAITIGFFAIGSLIVWISQRHHRPATTPTEPPSKGPATMDPALPR
jgi:hypothetical protein